MVSDLEGMVHLCSVIFGYGLYPQPYPAFWWFISALPVQTRHHKEKIKSTKKRTTVSKAPQKQQAARLCFSQPVNIKADVNDQRLLTEYKLRTNVVHVCSCIVQGTSCQQQPTPKLEIDK